MDIPVAAAAPWIVLGAALGMLLLVAVGATAFSLLRHRPDPRAADTEPATTAAAPHDDLPSFLESPPGSGDTPPAPTAGWAALAPAPVRGPVPSPPPRSGTPTVLLASALALVVLVGVAAALAVVSGSEAGGTGRQGGVTGPGDVDAELTFGGVVLERRPVGVTATYPRVAVTSERGRAVAEVDFPRYNCLTAEAPDDPVAAGCTPAGTEYARLTAPELGVESGADGVLHITGRFPTWLRPNGSPAEATGRSYLLDITAEPAVAARPGEWVPATGTLRLGDDTASTTGGAADRLRIGG